ncbi:hypothetical protein DPMN_183094 [Dreissena polymorpha]|uniref:B box-type domain-containing protein n=3 Tax=Dreissena polymorpha TaxID=45954 RepID=A0A9D4I6S1_DREPO|nr:hypothetical protein DPMN_183094 [Dreissena polymorpha]
MEMFLVACDIHPNATLTMFCDDHSQLFCSNCFDLSHRQCIKVKPIQQAALKKLPDLKKLSIKIQNIHPQIDRFLTHLKDRKHALLLSYNELELNMIEDIRQSILGDFQESSVNETNANEIEKLRLKITNTLVNFEKNDVKDLQSTLLSLRDSDTHYIGNCSMLHDDLKKCNDIMQKIGINKELRFIAGTKCVFKIQQTLVLLGKVDKVLTLKEKFEHNVRIQSDTNVCSIPAICVFPDNQVLVADHTNKKLKLLDQQYKVVFARVVSAKPWAMCQITLLEAAVTVTDENTHEVQFVTVAYRRLKKGRRLKLSHDCIGIAHHQGILFVTSNTVLYKYKLNGELISKLYEDASDCCTVYKCDVSPTGDKLYISNPDHHKLLTMDMDGRVLATFNDP